MTEVPISYGFIEEIVTRLRDPRYLPTTDELEKVFSTFPEPHTDDDTAMDLMIAHGGHLYEYPTKEYIHGLGKYVAKQTGNLGGSIAKPITILEVAAGLGRLSHFLTQELDQIPEIKDTYQSFAVDDFSVTPQFWANKNYEGRGVIDMDYQQALQTYDPTIVIGSWLPSRRKKNDTSTKIHDWTIDFRNTLSVKEYILIGVPGRHATLEAFGLQFDDDHKLIPQGVIPDYERDGFVMRELGLSRYQICMQSYRDALHPSKTFAFSRKGII